MVDLKRYRQRDLEIIQAFQYDINAPEPLEVDEWEVVTCHPLVRDASCVREGHDRFVVGAGDEIHLLKHGDWIVIAEDHTRWVMPDADFHEVYELAEGAAAG